AGEARSARQGAQGDAPHREAHGAQGMTDLAVAPAIQRSADHFYTYEGERYPGVTGILSILDKSGPLMGWAARMTAEAAVDLATSTFAGVNALQTLLETAGPAGTIS